jgi:O-antigen/teichoic acid export membrane protein
MLNSIIIIIVLLGLTAYFPLALFIPQYLPNYQGSISIFRLAFPGLILSSTISAIKFNYFKIINKVKIYLFIGVIVLALSAILNFIVIFTVNDVLYITMMSVVSLFVWYIILELYFCKYKGVKIFKNLMTIIIGTSLFYYISSFNNVILSGIIYLITITLIIIVIFISDYKKIKDVIK